MLGYSIHEAPSCIPSTAKQQQQHPKWCLARRQSSSSDLQALPDPRHSSLHGDLGSQVGSSGPQGRRKLRQGGRQADQKNAACTTHSLQTPRTGHSSQDPVVQLQGLQIPSLEDRMDHSAKRGSMSQESDNVLTGAATQDAELGCVGLTRVSAASGSQGRV